MLRQPPRRIEHDAQRARAWDMARGELRIVGRHGAGADDHRVAQRAHAMQVQDVLLAGDELRFAGMGGDEAVEALAEMADGDRVRAGGAADRQVEIDHRVARIVGRQRDLEAGCGRQAITASGWPGARRAAGHRTGRQRRMLVARDQRFGVTAARARRSTHHRFPARRWSVGATSPIVTEFAPALAGRGTSSTMDS